MRKVCNANLLSRHNVWGILLHLKFVVVARNDPSNDAHIGLDIGNPGGAGVCEEVLHKVVVQQRGTLLNR